MSDPRINPTKRDSVSPRPEHSPLGLLLACAIGATFPIEVNLVGVLRISELLVAAVVIAALLNGSLRQVLLVRPVLPLLMLGGAWIASQYLSDQLNNTPQDKMLKGNANIAMILVSLLGFVALFLPDPRRYIAYLVGNTAGRGVDVLRNGVENRSELWDLGVAPWAGPLILLGALLLIVKGKSRSSTVALLLAYGAAAIVFGARSHGLVFLLTGVGWYYGTSTLRDSTMHRIRPTGRSIFRIGAVIAAGVSIVFIAYVELAKAGYLTEKARHNVQMIRNPYNPMNIFLSGRGGIKVAYAAITDKPVFGHGSKAYEPKYNRLVDHRRSTQERGEIPVHSTIFAAWVFSGVMGGVFWLYVLILHFRFVRESLFINSPALLLLCVLIFLSGLWNILFSPYGYARFSWPPAFAIIALAIHRPALFIASLQPVVR